MKKILPMILMGVSTACALDSFEAPTYQAGQPVAGKEGWEAEGAVVVSGDQSSEGNQSLKVEAGQRAWKAAASREGIQFFDVYILPSFGEGGKTLTLGGAELGFQKAGAVGKVAIFNGEASSVVERSSYTLPDGATGAVWMRVTVRVDRAAGVWDLFLDGKPVYVNVTLSADAGVAVTGGGAGPTYIDSFNQSSDNPLFSDADKDGMPDAEEAAYGLNPFADDRSGDLDGDGISNAQEMFAGTLPNVPGLPLPGTGIYLFVDNLNGNDANTGSRSFAASGADGPKASLKAAMADAPVAATIVVLKGKGLYDEGSRGAQGKNLTIKTVEPVTIK